MNEDTRYTDINCNLLHHTATHVRYTDMNQTPTSHESVTHIVSLYIDEIHYKNSLSLPYE